MKSRMKKTIWVIVPVILSLVVSCATTPKIKSPPEEFKANLGTIGVVSASFQPKVRLDKPMGKGAAARQYAVRGAGLVAAAGRHCYGIGCAGVLAAIPIGAAIGGIVGLIKGLPSNEIEVPEKTLKNYLDTVSFQETMRERFLTGAREDSRSRIVPLGVEGPKTPDELVTYASLSENGIETILEISVRNCRLVDLTSKRLINPTFYLSLAAGIKLIRVIDEKVIYTESFVDQGSNYLTFSDWAANDAEPFQKELDHAFQNLAGQILERLSRIKSPTDSPPAEALHEGEHPDFEGF